MSGRPVLVVATVLTDNDGDFSVEARDESGVVVAGPLVVDVAIRPGDEALNITPEGMRWRALNEAVRTLGLRIDGWHAVGPVPHDGTYAGNVLSTLPLAPITCAPWCADGTGHTGVLDPEDQACEGPAVEVDGHLVYLGQEAQDDPVRLHIDGPNVALSVSPSVARVLAAAILEAAGEVR